MTLSNPNGDPLPFEPTNPWKMGVQGCGVTWRSAVSGCRWLLHSRCSGSQTSPVASKELHRPRSWVSESHRDGWTVEKKWSILFKHMTNISLFLIRHDGCSFLLFFTLKETNAINCLCLALDVMCTGLIVHQASSSSNIHYNPKNRK